MNVFPDVRGPARALQCSSEDRRIPVPKRLCLELREYFDGTIDAWGCSRIARAKVVKRFHVLIEAAGRAIPARSTSISPIRTRRNDPAPRGPITRLGPGVPQRPRRRRGRRGERRRRWQRAALAICPGAARRWQKINVDFRRLDVPDGRQVMLNRSLMSKWGFPPRRGDLVLPQEAAPVTARLPAAAGSRRQHADPRVVGGGVDRGRVLGHRRGARARACPPRCAWRSRRAGASALEAVCAACDAARPRTDRRPARPSVVAPGARVACSRGSAGAGADLSRAARSSARDWLLAAWGGVDPSSSTPAPTARCAPGSSLREAVRETWRPTSSAP